MEPEEKDASIMHPLVGISKSFEKALFLWYTMYIYAITIMSSEIRNSNFRIARRDSEMTGKLVSR